MSISKSQSILSSFITEVFEKLEEVPSTLLVDNMKTIMDQPRTEYQKGVVNEKFYQFAKDFGFEVKPCIAGRPQTKAKVDTPMKVLDEIHAYQGKFNYEELNQVIEQLSNRVNHQHNQGTGNIPTLSFQKEKASLSPLPRQQIRNAYKVNHKLVEVNPSNMINYNSNQYSVPIRYIEKIVSLQVYDNHLHVYYSTNLLVKHETRRRNARNNGKPYKRIDLLYFWPRLNIL